MQAQRKVAYKCLQGRYTLRPDKGVRHYCFDGTHYTASNAPPDVKAFFDNLKKSTPPPRKSGRRTSSRSSASTSQGATRRSAHTATMSTTTDDGESAARAEPSAKPAPKPLAAGVVRQVTVGAGRSQVVKLLGEPHGRISGGRSMTASWLYMLEDGQFARIMFEGDTVSSVLLSE